MKKKVKASRFLAWYFSDFGYPESFERLAFEMMLKSGNVKITVEQLFNSCDNVPSFIVDGTNKDDLYECYPHELELINDLK